MTGNWNVKEPITNRQASGKAAFQAARQANRGTEAEAKAEAEAEAEANMHRDTEAEKEKEKGTSIV